MNITSVSTKELHVVLDNSSEVVINEDGVTLDGVALHADVAAPAPAPESAPAPAADAPAAPAEAAPAADAPAA